MSPLLQRVAVILPIALLAVMVGRAEWQMNHSQTWHFAIQGYDPRDLLRGHYMRFRLDITPGEIVDSCSLNAPDCCYCLDSGEELEARVTLATCETAASTCGSYVRTEPLHKLNRFYIPEEGRGSMETQLREAALEERAHLAVAVSSEGEPMIEALLIDGQPIQAATPEEEPTED